MAARKSSWVNRKYKTKYRIRNWREYERGLRSRGDSHEGWLRLEAIGRDGHSISRPQSTRRALSDGSSSRGRRRP